MPGQLLHLAVAQSIIDEFNPQDRAQYYLGAIAPDAIHAFANAERSRRISSHLMADDMPMHESDNIETKANAVRLYLNAENDMPMLKSFKLGYCIHVLTDIYWLKTIYLNFLSSDIIKDMEIAESDKIYYYEMDKSSYDLLINEKWKPEVFKLLSDADAPKAFPAVTAEEINEWCRRTLNWYDAFGRTHVESARYILPKDIRSFLKDSKKYIMKSLNK